MTPATASPAAAPLLVVTQGDPAGVGPELMLRLAAAPPAGCRLLLVAERAALAAVRHLERPGWERLRFATAGDDAAARAGRDDGGVVVLDPVAQPRAVTPGDSGRADAAGALAALDAGVALVRAGDGRALVTLPVAKSSIARHLLPAFRGHTDYLAAACGLDRYGRDYLMAFLAPELQVALLTVHEPLRQALDGITTEAVVAALGCLERHAGGRIAVAGVNPHAGEGGLLGGEDDAVVAPAVAEARRRGWRVDGPESPDSVFARARGGAWDWVLALYHDQGLIAVKTAAWGQATNWTLGLPYLRTSVDHGTAFDIAGRGVADDGPLRAVLATTLALVRGELPRRSPAEGGPERGTSPLPTGGA
jgi:4-hydroxythreonine-4-phosphate dehydrogenase